MRSMPTWDSFRYKYQSEELQRVRFEDLARAIFCNRYNIKYGIFQCLNHAGNETDTIEEDGQIIGFQAKYFSNHIDKGNIIKSIETAHSRHPEQTKVIIYTNIPFGNPPKGQSKTSIQKSIDDKAAELGITTEWANDTIILDQAAQVEWIYDVFFGTEPNLASLVKEEITNTESILGPISSEISYAGKTYKVDRSEIASRLLQDIAPHKHFVIHGEGGSGKSGLVKDIWKDFGKTIPVCIRKAEFFKGITASDVFKQTNSYTAEQFISAISTDKKIFVIDSAERLQEIEDDTVLRYILDLLDNNGWSIIFTVRNAFLNELKDNLGMTYKLKCSYVSIDNISVEEIDKIAASFGLELPNNESFKNRLTNLFYLDLYANCNGQELARDSYKNFIDRAWKTKIAGNVKTAGISIKRENCFKEIVTARVTSGKFYAGQDEFDAEPLQKLIDDEIIAINPKGLYITHDIYEEWGLTRIVNDAWNNRMSLPAFFESLGTSYVIRRAYRLWLTDKIDNNEAEVSSILEVSGQSSITPLWQDEIIVAILHSSYASKFLSDNEPALIQDNSALLNRVVFLLQLACKQFVEFRALNGTDYPIYAPEGAGWPAVIEFLFKHQDYGLAIKYQTNVLSDWTRHNSKGPATRYCGLMALNVWSQTENQGSRFLGETYGDALAQIICDSAFEIKEELVELIDKIVANQWFWHNRPYYNLSQYILTRPAYSRKLIAAVPLSVIKLADAFWTDGKDPQVDRWDGSVDFNQEHRFGIREADCRRGYSPASSMQSPMFLLLCFKPKEALDFFISFTNKCVTHYKSVAEQHDYLENIVLHLPNGQDISVVGNLVLWGLYRGAVHSVVPDLFQSIHMALEKFLLDEANDGHDRFVMTVFDILLQRSQSVSTTAIISSVVCAHPEKYWKYAIILFKTPELFNYDRQRFTDENLQNTFYGMNAYRDLELAKERMATLNQPFRKRHLESLCAEYQYVHFEGMSEEEQRTVSSEISATIDLLFCYANQLPDNEKNILKILLYRMDRRKHEPKVKRIEGKGVQIELNPSLPDDLRSFSEDSTSHIEQTFRFLPLFNWAVSKAAPDTKTEVESKYDNDPELVVSEIKDLIEELSSGVQFMPMDNNTPYIAAGEVIVNYSDKLCDESKLFCKELIDRMIDEAFGDMYAPQIHDGLESCIHAIPVIMHMFPDEAGTYKRHLIKLLLNTNSIGNYKRICDYAIDALKNEWLSNNRTLIDNVFICEYIYAALQIERITQEEISKGNMHQGPYGIARYSMAKIFDRIDIVLDSSAPLNIESLKIEDLTPTYAELLLDIHTAKAIDRTSIEVMHRLTPIFAATLPRLEDYHSRFDRQLYLYRTFADYLLDYPESTIPGLLQPFIEKIDGYDNSKYFLEAFIMSESIHPRVNTFWAVWKTLYQTISDIKHCYSTGLIKSYMLAAYGLCETKSWETLRSSDLWLYEKMAKDCGDSPAVLFSISKSLNYYACNYIQQGIGWIYAITSMHNDLRLGDCETETIFYLEKILNNYVRKDRMSIKADTTIKDKIVNILTFMVARNSTQAYMLRELIA